MTPSGTYQHTTALISSNFGSDSRLSSFARGRIENWGAARFESNAERASRVHIGMIKNLPCFLQARQGMSLIMSKLRSYQPLPNTQEAEETDWSRQASQEQKDRRPPSFYAQRFPIRTRAASAETRDEEWQEYRPASARRKFEEARSPEGSAT